MPTSLSEAHPSSSYSSSPLLPFTEKLLKGTVYSLRPCLTLLPHFQVFLELTPLRLLFPNIAWNCWLMSSVLPNIITPQSSSLSWSQASDSVLSLPSSSKTFCTWLPLAFFPPTLLAVSFSLYMMISTSNLLNDFLNIPPFASSLLSSSNQSNS